MINLLYQVTTDSSGIRKGIVDTIYGKLLQ